jgi:hypothetical protein
MPQVAISEDALEHLRNVAEMIEQARVSEDDFAKARNERFNIFTTLLKAHDEVHLHTRFLHCLLDPNGYHDCGSRFLELFFDTLVERPGLDHNGESTSLNCPRLSKQWTVEKEASRPPCGQIDILIEQSRLFGIALENKIYAGEQSKQLECYAEYLSEKFGSNALLLYLTLDGKKSDTHKGTVPYLRISYADHILPWLDKCLWETSRIIPINQVLLQYREVVRQLTGKTIRANAMKEITRFILSNPDIIRHRAQIVEAINAARVDFLDDLAAGITHELKSRGHAVALEKRFGEQDGALIISPLASSGLSRLPVKIWVENWKMVIVGIKIPLGYKTLPSMAQQHLLEEMCRIMDKNLESGSSRKVGVNEAWPTGYYELFNPLSDGELFSLINKNTAVAASEMCDAICSHIELLEQAYVKASSPPSQSDSGTLK